MNIEQQRKAFDEWFKSSNYYTGDNCTPKYITYRSMWRAWLAAQQQEGYVVVPIKPNEAMHQAGQDMVTFGCGYDDIYGAMVEASRE